RRGAIKAARPVDDARRHCAQQTRIAEQVDLEFALVFRWLRAQQIAQHAIEGFERPRGLAQFRGRAVAVEDEMLCLGAQPFAVLLESRAGGGAQHRQRGQRPTHDGPHARLLPARSLTYACMPASALALVALVALIAPRTPASLLLRSARRRRGRRTR